MCRLPRPARGFSRLLLRRVLHVCHQGSGFAKEHAKEPLDTAIFYMDMRTYGKDFERYYDRARDEIGVRFVRSRIHSVEPAPMALPILF